MALAGCVASGGDLCHRTPGLPEHLRSSEPENKPYAYERGPLAHWALETGGFPGLLALDAVGVIVLCLLAVAVRSVYAPFGYGGYGRAAYVLLLMPYAVAASLATVNNLERAVI